MKKVKKVQAQAPEESKREEEKKRNHKSLCLFKHMSKSKIWTWLN
jgi:hypothetical protein